MILYFSGTGNSEYAAKRIGKALNDETVNLFQKIRSHDFSGLASEKPWVIVSPTYGWRIPRILQEWLSKTSLKGSKDIYFVMTCGGNIGNAGRYAGKLCSKKGLTLRGCIPVVMPENYIALFEAPAQNEALEIIQKAEPVLEDTIRLIKNRESYAQPRLSLKDRLNSGIVNDIYYPVLIHAKKFYVTEKCTSCGMCEKLCPLNNITIEEGKPVWQNRCTHCMACICRCPSEAIEYGDHSKGLVRYRCPKHL
ncbi:EFR1 family ferrodoxin [Anaerostipes sp.]|uniref:EFR1 family ferrodoxin n=1 Tax=Anaerostipes sp. TaxID=1872530 RepID=UPI0025C4860C|nr:EFR1 family ferrodoxin [Anaerostipes sp.]MBS7007711.1 EFR1 family ferrodoxin [Anaerostipes sp.]